MRITDVPRVSTYTLEVELDVIEPVLLPGWLGSTLHGALGWALSEVDPSSSLLAIPEPPSNAPGFVRSMGTPPLLVVPPPPGAPRQLAAGETFRFGIVLVGEALRELTTVLRALRRVGEAGLGEGRGRAMLLRVSDRAGAIASGGRIHRDPLVDEIAAPPERSGPSLLFRTVTPLRLEHRKEVVDVPELADLVGAAARRILTAAALHERRVVDVRVDALIDRVHAKTRTVEHAFEPFVVDRWSERQKKRHSMAGTHGWARYEGDLEEAVAWLAAAQHLGIGKSTTFGFGRVALEEEAPI